LDGNSDPRYKSVFLTKEFQDNIDITEVLEILIGCMLGDGTFVNKYTIKFEQGHKNRIYLFYLFISMFRFSKKWPTLTIRYDPRYGKHYYSWKFLIVNKNLTPLYNIFKDPSIFLDKLPELFTPRSLAYWIMDDGSKVERGGLLLHTNSYNKEIVNGLSAMLNNKFNIRSKVYDKKKGLSIYNIIYIPKEDYLTKLVPLIEPYFVETMKYKLGK
jgi:hypothetical protein